MFTTKLIVNARKFKRKLNQRSIFLQTNANSFPTLIVAGYTRSGTTYLGRLLASILGARYVHEPLRADVIKEISFFHPRERKDTILSHKRYSDALRVVFGPEFKKRDQGNRLFYKGDRIVKIVRGCFYLETLANLFPKTGIVVLIRNPASAIASRIRKGWEVPDLSECSKDIWDKLSQEQKDAVSSSVNIHERLAVTWCLDNLAMLRNLGKERFIFLFYEVLLLKPFMTIRELLEAFSLSASDRRIKREAALSQLEAPKAPWDAIRGWEGILSKERLSDIDEIVSIFGLTKLYDVGTGMPREAFVEQAMTSQMGADD